MKRILALLLVIALMVPMSAALSEAATDETAYGEWSEWSTDAVAAVPGSRQVETKVETEIIPASKQYTYTRWSYFNIGADKTRYSYAQYQGVEYKEDSGKWEEKTTDKPLNKVIVLDGRQQYEGTWFNETVKDIPESTKEVTYYRFRDRTAPPEADDAAYGEWSAWSTDAVAAVPDSRQVETKVETETIPASKQYTYSRWSYFNLSANMTYYSHVQYEGSEYKEGTGKWEYNTTAAPLDKSSVIEGVQEYAGNWYNETVEDIPESTKEVTYYRFRDRTALPEADAATYGEWSAWSTDAVAAVPGSRQVEKKVETQLVYQTVYNYSRWRYVGKNGNWWYAPADMSDSDNYVRGGEWEFRVSAKPLDPAGKAAGAVYYVGSWFNETSEQTPTGTENVTYYRFRDRVNETITP